MLVIFFILCIIILIILFYKKHKKHFEYWKEKGVPFLKPVLIFGNIKEITLGQQHQALCIQNAYNYFCNRRYFGFYEFSTPVVIVRDLNLIKRICISDFDYFTDHTDILPDPLFNKMLFTRKGADWQRMRNIVSPVFTSGKLKAMFPLLTDCAKKYVNHFNKEESGSGTITLELRDAFTRFTNDVIASCGFGIECDSLNNRNNEFYLTSKSAFDFSGLKSLYFFAASFSPGLINFLKINIFTEEIKIFFRTIVNETIEYREKTGIVRPDMIHLLREAQKRGLKHEIDDNSEVTISDDHKKEVLQKDLVITNEDITGHFIGFIFGGYETISVLLSQMSYELVINSDIQDRLIQEIDNTFEFCNGEITYQAVLEMKYLDMVVSETLRLWPPLPSSDRKCVKPYTIKPVSSDEKPLHVDVGTRCLIPIYSIHMDENYFPNPKKFDPERFSSENKYKIQAASFMPFGIGPRYCIGDRFALLEAKVFMVFLLAQFNIVPVAKSTIPMVIKNGQFGFTSRGGYWFGLKMRNK